MLPDVADQAIISQILVATTGEMGAKMMRSAYSPILREGRDGAAALLNVKGQVVAQAELIPIQLGSIGMTIRACLAQFPGQTLTEDDFFLTNDPFNGGQHLHDVFLFTPIFFEERHVGFSATVAHHVDIGGVMAPTATDLQQEGLILPPLKLSYSRDWCGGPFERLIRANTRLPDHLAGDLNAQFSANAVGALRFRALCEKYGPDLLDMAMAGLIDYSERRVRAAIREARDGVYKGVAFVDDDGISETPLRVEATVTIAGDSINVDFTGTGPQVERNLNSTYAATCAAAVSCVKSVLTDTDIPFNEGVSRPISVTAPEGTLVNPRPPAPSRSRMQVCYRAFNAVMGALSQALPDRAIAQGYDTTTGVLFAHRREERYSVSVEVFGGGYGASADADGCDAIDSPLSNCANTPVEAMDLEYPFLRVLGYGIDPDSFGQGRFRGGAGIVRTYESLEDGVTFTLFSDRFRVPAAGLFGGEDGVPGRCLIKRNGKEISVASKSTHRLDKGDIVELHLGGGGGYGNPVERRRELRDFDRREGYTVAWDPA